jgi:AcrR family transcriptional regulator
MDAKQPKQERSKVMFRSILEATTQLLNKVSDSKLTTRGIAERAGVSIGSLYQYFQSADSILSEVLKDRILRDVAETWIAFESGPVDEPVQVRMERVFQKILAMHLPMGRARTFLFNKAPSLKLIEFGKEQIEGLAKRMFQELKGRGQLRADLDEDLAVYLLSRTVFAVTMSATIDHEEMVKKQEALARELARMIAGYVVIV